MIKITKITILTGSGTDQLILHTELPEGVWPFASTATLTLHIARGKGEEYVKTNFPNVECEICHV
jgi:hypothetical protein